MGGENPTDRKLPTFGELRDWVWITGVGCTIGFAFFVAGTWIAGAEDSHEKIKAIERKAESLEELVVQVQEAIQETRAEKEVSEAILGALCTDPKYIASPVCVKIRLEHGGGP